MTIGIDSESELALEMSGQEMWGFARKLLFTPIAAAAVGPFGPFGPAESVLESRLEAPSCASFGAPEGSPEGSPPFLCHSHCHLLVLFFQPLARCCCGFTGEEAFW